MKFLKEWDIVCRALEDGRQIFLARKGGILDDGGLFVPAYNEFYLYPTFLHQSEQFRDYLKPSEWAPYNRARETPPDVSPKDINVRIFARVADIYKISDLAQ